MPDSFPWAAIKVVLPSIYCLVMNDFDVPSGMSFFIGPAFKNDRHIVLLYTRTSVCEVHCVDHPCAGAMLHSHFSINMNDCADPSLRTGPCCTHTLKKTCLCGASFLRHTDI